METQIDVFKEASILEEAAKKLIASKFPIKLDGDREIDIEGLKVNRPKDFESLAKQHKIKLDRKSLTGDIKGILVIKKNGKIEDKTSLISLFELPYKTQRGTYIVGGNEKSITSQMRLRPGIYTGKKDFKTTTTIRVDNKGATEKYIPTTKLEYNNKTGKFIISFDGKKIDGIEFLTDVAGLTTEEIRAAVGDPALFADIKEHRSKTQTKADYVFGRLGEDKDNDANKVRDLIFSSSNFGIGQKSTMQNIGADNGASSKDILLKAINRTMAVAQGNKEQDNKDDLRFKYIVNGNDLILEQLDKQLTSFIAKVSRMSGDVKVDSLQNPISYARKGFKSFLIGTSADATGLVENPEQLNPLHNGASARKVTQMGAGGMSGEAARNANETRDLQITGITRLDPIETPESSKIGLASHLSQTAKVKDGTIYTQYHEVNKGKADSSKIVELSPEDEFDKYVAFYDPRHVKREGNVITIVSDVIPGRYKGALVDIKKNDVNYIDPSPADIFGDPATLIPFGNHNDGNRMLMGASMQKQSVTLARDVREAPLVQSAMDENRDKTYEQKLAEKNGYTLKAPVNGTVTKVTDSVIEITDSKGKVHSVEQYNYFPLNQGNFINNEPTVKVGDKVKSGDLIADGWQTKDGQLALGLNTRVAYLPYEGFNYEDGIVVSESYAKRMKTEEIAVKQFEVKKDWIAGPGSDAVKLLRIHTNCTADLNKLDANTGLVKKGQEVGPGDILVAMVKVKDNSNLSAADQLAMKLLNGDKEQYVDVSGRITANEYLKGKVLDVSMSKGDGDISHVVTVRIKTNKEMKLGDKVAGRHGNKGTITKILPDNQMPHDAQGRPVDLIFSPLAIPSRKNLGQLMEVNAGLIAEKEGKPWKVYNFDENDAKKVQERLAKLSKESNGEITEDGKTYLYDPTVKGPDGKPLRYDNPVTVGNMYVMKLKHKVDDKIQSRSGLDGKVNEMYLSPSKEVGVASGERRNPQSIGSMEMWGLESHGAAFNILESVTLKGDGAGDAAARAKIFSALASKDPSKIKDIEELSGQPESLKILKDSIQALGLQVTPQKNGSDLKTFDSAFDALRLSPAKDSEILKMIGKENKVKNGYIYRIDANGNDVPEDDGLFDPKIFGTDKDEQRNKWGYIELPVAMPLPALMQSSSYNPYKILTHFKEDELKDIMNKSDVVVITNPKDSNFKEGQIAKVSEVEKAIFDEGLDVEFKAGGEAIKHYLGKIDLDAELESTREALKTAKASKVKELYPKYKVLNNLKERGLEPTDLVTNIVPVTPIYLRPRIQKGRNEMIAGTTTLYRNLANFTQDTNRAFEAGYKGDAFTEADANAKTYEMLRQLHGFGEQFEDAKGITQNLGGKEGLVRDRMLGKQVDYSGRSVIGVDPSLNIDEAGLPYDMAKRIFLPFIVKELVNMGSAKNEKEAKDMIKNNNADVLKAMKKVAEERPILLNRAPSLHKFSIMAFKPKIIEQQDGQVVRNIYLNPLVTPGFNADFDGDTMAVHAPLSDRAVEEAYNLMMPSKNLISPKDGKMVIEIRHEMALGSYYLTQKRELKGKPVMYNGWLPLWRDYKEGKISIDQAVTMHNRTEAAGMWLFFAIFPEPYRTRYMNKVKLGQIKGMGEKQCGQLLRELYDDISEGNKDAEKLGLTDLSIMINRVKDVSFKAATRSGLSVSIKDFTSPNELKEEVHRRVEEIKTKYPNDEKARIEAAKKLQKDLEKKYGAGVLGEDNPVNVLMASGARGGVGVIRRMSGFVGVGRNINNQDVDPILHSHMEGLSPNEFYLHGYDSRKGMADRALSTAEPGAVTRQLWSVNQSETLTEKNCGTKDGINMKKEGAIVGRAAAVDIKGANGVVYVKAGDFITKSAKDAICKDDTINMVKVRSVMTCETVNGTCQTCYGWEAGKIAPPALGTAIGTIAAQSVGEPMTQMVMRTFHGGGDVSSVSLGMPRVQEVLGMNDTPKNQAVLSQTSGVVTRITPHATGTDVVVGTTVHKIKLNEEGKQKPLRVKVGDKVQRGDFLTTGSAEDIRNGVTNLTSANPHDIIKFKDDPKEATNAVQDYLATSMQYAINASLGDAERDAVDRRHVELTVSKLTENVRVTDSSVSPYVEGDVIKRVVADKWNKQYANPFTPLEVDTKSKAVDLVGCKVVGTYKDKSGNIIAGEGHILTKQDVSELVKAHKTVKIIPTPIKYEPVIVGVKTAPTIGHENWFSNLGHENLNNQLARGAVYGQTDKLEDSRARLMAGKAPSIGRGFKLHKTNKDLSNSFANSLANMFKK